MLDVNVSEDEIMVDDEELLERKEEFSKRMEVEENKTKVMAWTRVIS